MPKHFIKIKENFICQHCGHKTLGTGFTNHCPNCLYSLHVDKDIPGDRLSTCLSLMKPTAVTKKSDQLILHHRCLKCGKTISNKVAPNDNPNLLLQLSGQPLTRLPD